MIFHKKPLTAKTKKTYIAFVLDKSSSMTPLKDSTISAFNEQLDEHRKSGFLGGETTLSLVQFSGTVEETFFNIPVNEIEGSLDANQYIPNGSTALYDAIGYTINKLQRFDEPGDVGFLVIVLSDGANNASKKYDQNQIASLKKELEDTGRWTFQYIGCDATAMVEAAKTGFNVASFEPTKIGWNSVSSRLRGATSTYYASRAAGCCSVANLMDTSTSTSVSSTDNNTM